MRTKVGFMAPCIGVGGGDALMLGLIRYCNNLDFTGIFVNSPIEISHYTWARNACGYRTNFFQRKNDDPDLIVPGVEYRESHTKAVLAALSGCDIVISWCSKMIDRHILSVYGVPIIEYTQNSDKYAKDVINSNIGIIDYYAACSVTATNVLPQDHDKSVIYNGIDPGRVVPAIGRDRQREAWGLKDKKILLFMGRLVKEKHPEIVLNALNYLPDEWVAIFVGRGYQELDIYNYAQSMQSDRVFFVDSQYHVGDILAAADVFILPSDFEGHSLALSEAWFAGTPTVYTDFPTMLELEEKFGSLGIKIPRLSYPQEFAKAILEAASSNDEMLARVANARNVVWNNFTLPVIAAQWEEYVDYCLFHWRKKRKLSPIHIVEPQKLVEIAK